MNRFEVNERSYACAHVYPTMYIYEWAYISMSMFGCVVVCSRAYVCVCVNVNQLNNVKFLLLLEEKSMRLEINLIEYEKNRVTATIIAKREKPENKENNEFHETSNDPFTRFHSIIIKSAGNKSSHGLFLDCSHSSSIHRMLDHLRFITLLFKHIKRK